MNISEFPDPFSLLNGIEQLSFETDEILLAEQVQWRYKIASYDGPRTVIGDYKDDKVICHSWIDDHIGGHIYLVGKLDLGLAAELDVAHDLRKKYYGSTAQEFIWNKKSYCWMSNNTDAWNISQHADLQKQYQDLNLGKDSYELYQKALATSEIIGYIQR